MPAKVTILLWLLPGNSFIAFWPEMPPATPDRASLEFVAKKLRIPYNEAHRKWVVSCGRMREVCQWFTSLGYRVKAAPFNNAQRIKEAIVQAEREYRGDK